MNIDERAFQYVAKLRGQSKILDHLAVFGARHLVLVMALAAILFFCFAGGDTERLRLIGDGILSVLISWPLAVLLELVIGRRRPFAAFHKKPIEEFWTPTPSFPSVHAAIAFAITTPVFLFHPVAGIFFCVAALAVAASRVYVGVHYVSDVIAGGILGVAVSLLLHL